jgi:hypothetical protein
MKIGCRRGLQRGEAIRKPEIGGLLDAIAPEHAPKKPLIGGSFPVPREAMPLTAEKFSGGKRGRGRALSRLRFHHSAAVGLPTILSILSIGAPGELPLPAGVPAFVSRMIAEE